MSIQPIVDHYRNTEVGHHLQRLGREEGREEMLLMLLQSRFGKQRNIQAVMDHFTGWTKMDAVDAILAAPDIKTLLTTQRPD